MAPDRVAALVLVGTKANRRPDPDFLTLALETIRENGLATAWHEMWEPLFSAKALPRTLSDAKHIALRQSPEDVSRGVAVFHTRPSREDILSAFPGPVIVVTGSDDIAPGPKISEKQAKLAQQGSLHVIPECGHYAPLERPEAMTDSRPPCPHPQTHPAALSRLWTEQTITVDAEHAMTLQGKDDRPWPLRVPLSLSKSSQENFNGPEPSLADLLKSPASETTGWSCRSRPDGTLAFDCRCHRSVTHALSLDGALDSHPGTVEKP